MTVNVQKTASAIFSLLLCLLRYMDPQVSCQSLHKSCPIAAYTHNNGTCRGFIPAELPKHWTLFLRV